MQTKFKDFFMYRKNIKFIALKFVEIGKIIVIWILDLFFKIRLSENIDSYIFQLVLAVKNLAQEQTIHNMISVLVNYNKQLSILRIPRLLKRIFAIEAIN